MALPDQVTDLSLTRRADRPPLGLAQKHGPLHLAVPVTATSLAQLVDPRGQLGRSLGSELVQAMPSVARVAVRGGDGLPDSQRWTMVLVPVDSVGQPAATVLFQIPPVSIGGPPIRMSRVLVMPPPAVLGVIDAVTTVVVLVMPQQRAVVAPVIIVPGVVAVLAITTVVVIAKEVMSVGGADP